MKRLGYLLIALLATNQVIAQTSDPSKVGFLELREAQQKPSPGVNSNAIKVRPSNELTRSNKSLTFGQGHFQNEHFKFNIYPNPNSGEVLYLENKEATSYELEVIDMMGQLIIRDEIQPGAVANYDLSNWERGMYLFYFKQESGSEFTRKVAVFY